MPRTPDASSSTAIADLPCACAAARRVARALTQMYDGWLRSSEIEGPQFALLTMLDRQGSCTQTAMGRLFALDKTTLSRNLKLLKREGWIDVAPGEDARERRVSLTPIGRRHVAAARPAWRNAQKQLRSSMGAREWKAMWRVFRTITHAAQRATDQQSRVKRGLR
jgi:DNA-binding MarR family transcriptional regulator